MQPEDHTVSHILSVAIIGALLGGALWLVANMSTGVQFI